MYTNAQLHIWKIVAGEKGDVVITDIILSERGNPIAIEFRKCTKKDKKKKKKNC